MNRSRPRSESGDLLSLWSSAFSTCLLQCSRPAHCRGHLLCMRSLVSADYEGLVVHEGGSELQLNRFGYTAQSRMHLQIGSVLTEV